jgi:hypothetical protein
MFLAHVDDICFADLKKSQYDLPESEQSVYWHVIGMSLCICIPVLWVKLRRSHWGIEAYGCMWHGRIMIGGKVVHSDIPIFARHKNVSRIARPAAWGKVASIASYNIMRGQLEAYRIHTSRLSKPCNAHHRPVQPLEHPEPISQARHQVFLRQRSGRWGQSARRGQRTGTRSGRQSGR